MEMKKNHRPKKRMELDEHRFKQFQLQNGIQFKDEQLLIQSFTHSSYVNEHRKKQHEDNERLEFLGDAVLELSVSQYLYKKYPLMSEGDLTKIRAAIVCEPSLVMFANELQFGETVLLGKGEEMTGGRTRPALLADAFEALIGAIYIDGGIEITKKFIMHYFLESIDLASKGVLFRDYKTHLQELLQSKTSQKIVYNVVNEHGPDHNKIFDIEVSIGNKVIGRGSGKSKKEAEQKAAEEAIKKG